MSYIDTLWFIIVTDTLGTQAGVDLIDLITLGNGLIGALGFADITINTFVVYQ